MGKGAKKRAIESKSTIRTNKAEADKDNFDRIVEVISEKKESACVKHMTPDTVVGVSLIVVELEGTYLPFITGANFMLKRKIFLEKITVSH